MNSVVDQHVATRRSHDTVTYQPVINDADAFFADKLTGALNQNSSTVYWAVADRCISLDSLDR